MLLLRLANGALDHLQLGVHGLKINLFLCLRSADVTGSVEVEIVLLNLRDQRRFFKALAQLRNQSIAPRRCHNVRVSLR